MASLVVIKLCGSDGMHLRWSSTAITQSTFSMRIDVDAALERELFDEQGWCSAAARGNRVRQAYNSLEEEELMI